MGVLGIRAEKQEGDSLGKNCVSSSETGGKRLLGVHDQNRPARNRRLGFQPDNRF
jgi:hypothetical protein